MCIRDRMAAICILLSVSGQAYGQSLKDLLNSSTVKDAVTSVTGGKKLTVENLQGTWTYTNPAVQLEGDNALKLSLIHIYYYVA